jgi:hypothetical protein
MEFSKKRHFVIILWIALWGQNIFAQNPDEILQNAINKTNKVNDYVVDMTIKINVDFIEIPKRKVKLYFKQPNQFHYETKGFALIPKQAQTFSGNDFKRDNMSALYVKEDVIEGKRVHVIKAIPMDEDAPFVLATMWIDVVNFNIHKMESVTRNDGTYKLYFQYSNHPFDLPDRLEVEFELSKLDLPMGMDGSLEFDLPNKNKADKKTTGNVQIQYSNYLVNQGIDDSIFKKK